MSHYTVAVFTKEGQSVDCLLEPFDENIEVEPYVRRTKEEVLKEIEKYCDENEALRKKWLTLSDKEKMRIWAGYNDFDEDSNPLSTYNPNSKWDWYSVGGRWDNFLKTKNGEYVNECLVKDLDLTPNKEEYDKAIRFWELVIEHQPLEEGEKMPFNLYKEEYYIERYGTKENYAKKSAMFSTYAVLTPDGEWHEPGQMGWWGMSHASQEDEKLWDEAYENFLKEADPNWTITIVDCHI